MNDHQATNICLQTARSLLENQNREKLLNILTDEDIKTILQGCASLYLGRGVMPPPGSPQSVAVVPRSYQTVGNRHNEHSGTMPVGQLPYKIKSWEISANRWILGNLEFASLEEFDEFTSKSSRPDLYIAAYAITEEQLTKEDLWEFGYNSTYETTHTGYHTFGYDENDESAGREPDEYTTIESHQNLKGPFQSTFRKILEEACQDDQWWRAKEKWIKHVKIKTL